MEVTILQKMFALCHALSVKPGCISKFLKIDLLYYRRKYTVFVVGDKPKYFSRWSVIFNTLSGFSRNSISALLADRWGLALCRR